MTANVSLTCSEVWGSNKATETVLILPGLEGWITAKPYHNEAAGGDVHYISSCGTGRITRVLLADVSGHGSIVADVSENLRLLMQRYLNHVDPNKLAQQLNEQWSKQFPETGRFATAILLTYWSPTGGLSVCSAGHPMPLLYRANKQRWVAIDEPDEKPSSSSGGGGGGGRIDNLPLGIVEDAGYLGRQLNLKPGDMVLIYTDCLNEAFHPEHKQLGNDGLLDLLNTLPPEAIEQSPGTLTRTITDTINANGYALDDDLTTVVLRCAAGAKWSSVPTILRGIATFAKQLATGKAIPWPTLFRDNYPGKGL